jgi:hypothetical protein
MTQMAMSHTGPADAKGHFEVQLMPGAYELCVLPPPSGVKGPAPEPDGPPLKWTQTWYPGVAQAQAASKIVVLPGATVDVELKLLAVPTHAVRGHVLHPDGTPAVNAKLTLGERLPFNSVESGNDGAFELPAVAEGDWPIMAEASAGAVRLRANDWIEVGRHDVDNVKLRLAAPITMRGKVVVEAPKDTPPLRQQPLILNLSFGHHRPDRDLGPVGGLVPMITNGAGDFTTELYPGTYHLGPRLQPPPEPYYLDAILVGGVDIATQDVEIGSDTTMTVVYKTDGGSVAGKAENCASGGVLLVPGDPLRRRAGLSRSGPCDANDHYEVRAVPAGDYYALAFAGNGTVPPFDDALLNQAAKVTVKSGEASSLDLRAVTHPVY